MFVAKAGQRGGGAVDWSGTGIKGPVQIQQEGFRLGQGIFPG